MLGGEQQRVMCAEDLLGPEAALFPQRGIVDPPDHPRRIGMLGEAVAKEALLLLAELEPTHDPQEGPAAVVALEQLVVGVDFRPWRCRAVLEALKVEQLREREPRH